MLQKVIRKTILVRGLEIKENLAGWKYKKVVEHLKQLNLAIDETYSSEDVEYYRFENFDFVKHITISTKIFFDTTLVVFKQTVETQKEE